MDKKHKQFITALIGLLIIALSIFVGIKVLSPIMHPATENPGAVSEQPELPDPGEPETPPEEKQEKVYVPIVFIGKNASGEEVYKVIKREYDENIDGSKLRFAITSLIMGPKQDEKSGGVYSEVPTSTNILHIYDKEDKVIVDLSSGFVYGGGTESVYKRLFQLIKTINKNTDKPAFLYIDGKQADVIGGDGIMITQPLNEHSIGD
jgi:spore germination protein GerM